MIRQLRVRGYKSLQDDTLTMRPLRILIGANAAGKSNVVDALRFLPEAVPSDVATALARRGGLPTVVFLGSREEVRAGTRRRHARIRRRRNPG